MSISNYTIYLGRSFTGDKLLKEFLSSFNEPVMAVYDSDLKNYFIELKRNGISFRLDNKQNLTTIFFHSKDGEFSQYTGKMPFSINFSLSYDEVLEKLGTPDSSGGGKGEIVFGLSINPWLRYEYGNNSLHFTFEADKCSIKLITLF